jgi:uncharacterized protein YqhQ
MEYILTILFVVLVILFVYFFKTKEDVERHREYICAKNKKDAEDGKRITYKSWDPENRFHIRVGPNYLANQ